MADVTISQIPTTIVVQQVGIQGPAGPSGSSVVLSGSTPSAPLNSFQINSGGDFGGTSMYYDENNAQVGININTPESTLHVRGGSNGTGSILLETDSVGTEEKAFAALYFRVADNDGANYKKFAVIAENTGSAYGVGRLHFALDGDSGSNANADITDSKLTLDYNGAVYMPVLHTGSQPHIIGYNSASGELTYYSTSTTLVSVGGLISSGNVTVTGSLTVSGSVIPAEVNGTLGTADNPWKALYVDNGTIYFISGSDSGSMSWNSGSGFDLGPTTLTGNNSISGSLNITGSVTISGSSTLTNIGPFITTGESTFNGDVWVKSTPGNVGELLITSLINNYTSSFYTDNSGNLNIVYNGSNVVFKAGNNGVQATIPFTASSAVSLPSISNTVQSHVLGYDSTTGNVTYYSTSSFSAGNIISADTGSLMVTGSVSSNTLTFTKGDGTVFSLTVATGSSSSSGSGAFSYMPGVAESIRPTSNQNNIITAPYATIFSGRNNSITGVSASWSAIGGNDNDAEQEITFIHGVSNTAHTGRTRIFGVQNTTNLSPNGGTGGNIFISGDSNTTTSNKVFIWGQSNTVNDNGVYFGYGNVVIGDTHNMTANRSVTVGTSNTVTHDDAIVLGNDLSSVASDTTHVDNLHATGSVHFKSTLKLESLDTLPAGDAGMLAVSSSGANEKLYFYDGSTWREVSLL